MQKIKINKQKLSEKWIAGGGREVKSYCNYYLIIKSDDEHYLKEKLNLKGYLLALLMLPFAIPVLFLVFLHHAIEWLATQLEDVFVKLKSRDLLGGLIQREVRTDTVRPKDVDYYLEIKE
jgi:hypothetical protein